MNQEGKSFSKVKNKKQNSSFFKPAAQLSILFGQKAFEVELKTGKIQINGYSSDTYDFAIS